MVDLGTEVDDVTMALISDRSESYAGRTRAMCRAMLVTYKKVVKEGHG